ncbi:Delta 8-sphingolipid desaturase [Lasiodiplodia theobromae]|uniref:Delta 8-(E)-sphingolipid desaturase n=1 Tax=Lasiodiplodia theobromae TaxID=45133 RepID=A0A5N5D2E6_9PEZI|nr:Delta 8-sphingolipid desaturase [Lasiodiplodia theobromae]KAB2571863.1 Delta 8-(E)-sphingolipid desaturase [Lasiodiplodia theobromae]KAF4539599.1 Delta 8-sphingolipid desaturase [Lasiodiplodia theobromae]
MDRNRLISAREVERLVADGQLIVIHDGYALKLDRWIDRHPGGRLAILHMVGRDATDEINVYHFDKTLAIMKGYRIGRVHQPWTNLEPPIRAELHRTAPTALPAPAADPASSDSTDDDDNDASSIFSSKPDPLSSSNSSVGQSDHELDSGDCRRRNVAAAKPATSAAARLPTEKLSRTAYTAALEQKEIADGIRNYPSLDPETQQAIRDEYDALHQLVQAQGLYDCPYREYAKEMVRYAALFSLFIYFLNKTWYMTSAVFLGLFWQQIMFTAHDAGHRGITGNFVIDTLIGAFIADFCCGLSIGWWKSSHNVHHLVTNMPEHDPDIQNIPLFSTSPTYFKSIRSTFYNFTFYWDRAADILVPFQKYTYYPVMAIARFNLYLLSWLHLLSPRAAQLGSAWWTRWVEAAFMVCYWALFGYALLLRTLPDWPTRVLFVLVSHTITMILHVQITLSHWGMPTADLGPTESFAQRQLRTTMDVDCPAWLDFLHGGLQFQAVHHLFPRMPRHNLRAGQALVREFCAKTGIKYQCQGFVEGNKVVLTRLEEVANMVKTLVECQMHMAETGESGLH